MRDPLAPQRWLPTLQPLTSREKQTLALIVRGYENSAIAKELGVAVRTVKAYCNQLFLKNEIPDGAGSRTRLAVKHYKPEATLAAPISVTSIQATLLNGMCGGLTNREIAQHMGTTEQVAKNYCRILFDHLGVWNRLEAALWWTTYKDQVTVIEAKIRADCAPRGTYRTIPALPERPWQLPAEVQQAMVLAQI